MVKTLFFDLDKNKKSIIDKYARDIERGDVIWTHFLRSEDKFIDAISEEVGQNGEFQKDLLEAQRPRVTRFKNFSVIVMSFPTKKTLVSEEDEINMFQVSFVVMKNKLVTVSDLDHPAIIRIMEKLSRKKYKVDVSILLSDLIDELTEHSIRVISDYEMEIEKLEKRVASDDKTAFSRVQLMKENLFYLSKMIKADVEVVRELSSVEKGVIEGSKINHNIKDRLLYAADIIDANRENLNNLTSVYMSMLSQRLNENIQRLTLVGAILLVPTIVTGFFGMNVDLPDINFYEIIALCIVVVALLLAFLKYKKMI
jgi:magnesium transporter